MREAGAQVEAQGMCSLCGGQTLQVSECVVHTYHSGTLAAQCFHLKGRNALQTTRMHSLQVSVIHKHCTICTGRTWRYASHSI